MSVSRTARRLAAAAAMLAALAAAAPTAEAGVTIAPGVPSEGTDFGAPWLGQTSKRYFVLTNSTGVPLRVQTPTLSGSAGSQGDLSADVNYSSDRRDCPWTWLGPPTLGPGGTCVFVVNWTPTVAGPASASLYVSTVLDNGQNSTSNVLDLQVGGRGIEVTPDRLAFGSQALGSLSAGKSITVNAPPGHDVRVRWERAGREDFVTAFDDCSGVAIVRGVCEIGVRFAPTGLGSRSATLVVTDETNGDIRSVTLAGTGIAVPPGPKGDKGDPGTPGTPGAPGGPGAKGDPGAQGIQGIQGTLGAKGDPGAKGDTGAQGTQGIQGTPGPEGDTGAQGIQGMQSIRGAQSERGATGPQGPAGQVTCRNTAAARAICDVVFAPGTWKVATTATVARYTVSRGGRVVARGSHRAQRRFRISLPHRLRSGRYVVTVRTGRSVVRQAVSIA